MTVRANRGSLISGLATRSRPVSPASVRSAAAPLRAGPEAASARMAAPAMPPRTAIRLGPTLHLCQGSIQEIARASQEAGVRAKSIAVLLLIAGEPCLARAEDGGMASAMGTALG